MNKADVKKSILESAIKVFAGKGFVESTISDIARGAGIADSGVYNYFKGKEEILFTIPKEEMKIFLVSLQDQLDGIRGADNKLRKLIWHQCKYGADRKDYTHVLLLECRSNTRFYNSEAYMLIKEYSRKIEDIIEEGVKEGGFAISCPPRLVRDMVMGALDHMTLNWIMKEGPSPLGQAEKICELVINALSLARVPKILLDPKTKKKKRIINAATKIFAEKGYGDTTVAEIARKAGVAEGTIYEYYQSKENLIISIPEEKLRELLGYINQISPEKKLERFILFYLRFLNNNRDFTSLLVMMLRPNRRFYRSESQKVIDELSDNLKAIVVEGKEKGVFSKEIDILTFQDLVFGTIDHIIIPWVMFKRKYDLLQVGEEASKLFINALKA